MPTTSSNDPPRLLTPIERTQLLDNLRMGCPRALAARHARCRLVDLEWTIEQEEEFYWDVESHAAESIVHCHRRLSDAHDDPRYWRAGRWKLECQEPEKFDLPTIRRRLKEADKQRREGAGPPESLVRPTEGAGHSATFTAEDREKFAAEVTLAVSEGIPEPYRERIAENMQRYLESLKIPDRAETLELESRLQPVPAPAPSPTPPFSPSPTLASPAPATPLESRLQPVLAPTSAAELESRLQSDPAPAASPHDHRNDDQELHSYGRPSHRLRASTPDPTNGTRNCQSNLRPRWPGSGSPRYGLSKSGPSRSDSNKSGSGSSKPAPASGPG